MRCTDSLGPTENPIGFAETGRNDPHLVPLKQKSSRRERGDRYRNLQKNTPLCISPKALWRCVLQRLPYPGPVLFLVTL